ASIGLWQRAGAALGADLEVWLDRGLMVAAHPAPFGFIEAKDPVERAAGLPIELLDDAALRRIAPYVSERMVGAAYCRIEGKANPLTAGPAFAAAAAARGARIQTQQQVVGIRRDGAEFEVATATQTY